MSKAHDRWRRKPQPPRHQLLRPVYNLDRFTLKDIEQGKERQKLFSRVYWGRDSEFAYQRSLIKDEIKAALLSAAVKPFTFSKFQRAVKYKWSEDPLSSEGSLKDAGGRFNVGDIYPAQFPVFPALYLGEDKDTALQEIFQCETAGLGGLTGQELALTKPDSISIVSVYGSLESIIDLYDARGLKGLQGFIDLIKDFEHSEETNVELKKLGDNREAVKTMEGFLSAVYEPNWRSMSMQIDLPAASQTFGQLVAEAGIEGIRYKSKFTGKPCLAIFPQNFVEPDSFVQLSDQPPPGVTRIRLEAKKSEKKT
jgi:hypothetical protein